MKFALQVVALVVACLIVGRLIGVARAFLAPQQEQDDQTARARADEAEDRDASPTALTLAQAAQVINQRKSAVMGAKVAGENMTVDRLRPILVGLDLNAPEVVEEAQKVTAFLIFILMAGQTSVEAALNGAYAEGVMAGALYTQRLGGKT